MTTQEMVTAPRMKVETSTWRAELVAVEGRWRLARLEVAEHDDALPFFRDITDYLLSFLGAPVRVTLV